jgi:3-ketosteroid 9alpha-monooxygenase subunit A
MQVPFTWRPAGWFMIGWSADFPVATARPLKYFGQDLVAYRTDAGELHVLDAHCLHLGAHLGRGGSVLDDCIACPYHGWTWGPDGSNRAIPYEDRPNLSKQLRSWPIDERHEWVFMWHDPNGGPPEWSIPDLWSELPQLPGVVSDYYRAYPEMSVKYEREPVHPQLPMENAPDSVHFKYVHRASVQPVLVDWKADGPFFRTTAGWPRPTADDPDAMALKIHNISCGVGGSLSMFEGAVHYRLAFFTTPVDDESSDMFYSIWWPRDDGDDSVVAPPAYRERAAEEFLQTLHDDLEIWRYQVYVENPVLARQDARPYGALRKWARQFYELNA